MWFLTCGDIVTLCPLIPKEALIHLGVVDWGTWFSCASWLLGEKPFIYHGTVMFVLCVLYSHAVTSCALHV